jgi:hypothetical protein
VAMQFVTIFSSTCELVHCDIKHLFTSLEDCTYKQSLEWFVMCLFLAIFDWN